MHLKEVKIGEEIVLKKFIDKYRPLFYAGASGDFNPIHIDPDFGKMVGLGGNILQGLCTTAFCQQLVVDWCGHPSFLKKLKVRFKSPVRPEDTITIKGKVMEKTDEVIKIEITAENQKNEVVIGSAFAEVALS